ncbi:MAG: class II fructose-bisphosphatase [Chloroflexi bacterium]|nr:class II fructose-bisphosphatase [Chloroflexi bacterium CFX1]MCK6567062.1 class II fructose-bisphosphatase [Anaerolineales bacterium]MCQ3954246.1 class II fructose-bisphosphatase [Chloroflexota bacterium]MDL1920732.1 class II fructose-bisphosphatase [Chloroflexi bacterium CFX5]NUQ60466.1 class II fructose-bisphosphatase [Anaerolineales bacterium]
MEVLGATPTRNLALELARVTEAAAMMAGRFMGRGDKEGADQAAVNAMRLILGTVEMNGIIVIGEGEKDAAPMLYNGEKVGNGSNPDVDVAVDPIDGTRPLAFGRSNSLATVALAPRGTMFDPGPFVYMDKIAVGPEAKGRINIEKPITENLKAIAKAKGKAVEDLTTIILDRPRHAAMIAEIRKAGARIRQIPDGDVAAALMTAWPDAGVDVLLGIGGTPEGVIAACALRAMGGEIQGKLYARDEDELNRGREAGYDFDKILTMDDLVSSEDVFFAATGITDGELLKGVRYYGDRITTDTLVVRGLTGTIREIIATHTTDKLDNLSSVSY